MVLYRHIIALCLFASLPVWGLASQAQKDSSSHRTRFFLLGGVSWAAVDLGRYNNQTPHLGLNGRLYCYIGPSARLAAEYTYILKHKDDPTWINVEAQSYELNAHLTGVIEHSQLGFYALTGVCMQQWKGEFTGLNDFKGFAKRIDIGAIDTYTHYLANFGCGFEKNFKYGGLYAEFKFRLSEGDSNVKVRINDVTYGMGLKLNIRMRKPGKLFRGPGDKYHWF